MVKNMLWTARKNLTKNLPLLLSTAAMLCLFLLPTPFSVLMAGSVLAVEALAALFDGAKPPAFSKRSARLAAAGIAVFLALLGFHSFRLIWTPSSKVAAVAQALSMSASTLVLLVGLAGCAAGFYAMDNLACWVLTWVGRLLGILPPVQRKTGVLPNLQRNWFFPFCAAAFFCMTANMQPGFAIGALIVLAAACVAAARIPSILDFVKQSRIGFQAAAVLTTLGICWGGKASLFSAQSGYPIHEVLEYLLGIPVDYPMIVGGFVVLANMFFVYLCLLVFWKEMWRIFTENRVFHGVRTSEWIVYSILLIAAFAFVILSFAKTDAFYGTEYGRDIIYTSDSPALVKGKIYLTLAHPENDLRQPLFALFASPFVGISYLVGKLLGASASVQAMLLNLPQVVLLFAANFLLAKMMKLDPVKRICFLLLSCCTYTQLLFTLMMEQYIVAYFWLILCIYLISEHRRTDRIALWGAGGTLLTSMILLPFLSEKHPFHNFKAWLADMVKYGLEFLAVLLAFGRWDVICDLTAGISTLSAFTGRGLTMQEKFYQYIAFVRNCFAAPNAGANTTAYRYISWQLNPVAGIRIVGAAIVLLVIVSAVWNRGKRSSLLAAGWAAFSVVILLGLGWGTMENGLILYSLYFGWAFLVLLFQLVERIGNSLNVKFLLPAVSIGSAVVLAAVNIPAIMEMLRFSITNYPA